MAQGHNDIKIEIKIDENIASGKFSNFTNISHSADEFVMDFIFIHPSPPPGFGKMVSRILMTPAQSKRLLETLKQNLGEYESRFGEIRLESAPGVSGNIQ
jgi:hypothetical protein